jgi:predicted acyltransferase
MFIVGVAMVFSLNRRLNSPDDWNQAKFHIIKRCIILFFLGVLLHCVYSGKIVWELWNVLTQLAFTILIAYSLFRFKLSTQILASIFLLILTEVLYRFFPVEGFNHPFVMGENFGSWMDLLLMGKINGDGWVVINFLPTAAHTIWGVVAGKILISERSAVEKIKPLLIAGLICLAVGYTLDITQLTPIIKRIATSSFVIASGGWCLLVLAASYWLIDVMGFNRFVIFFSIVGMNSIFIYMFAETIGHQWLIGFASIFSEILFWVNANEAIVKITGSLLALAINWYLCYWLYKHKIFFKI